MLAGNISGAYRVTPADPVSKISGMLTAAEPTAVTNTPSREGTVDVLFGYKLSVTGWLT